jgi:DNA-binding response OmpR family regulator
MQSDIRILLVDNDLDSLSRIYLKLVQKGISAEASENLEEVDARINRFKPNLILISQKMIGPEAGIYCKNLHAMSGVLPMLIVEAGDNTNYRVDFLRRPLEAEQLMALVTMEK